VSVITRRVRSAMNKDISAYVEDMIDEVKADYDLYINHPTEFQ
jgi:hypothetical protein